MRLLAFKQCWTLIVLFMSWVISIPAGATVFPQVIPRETVAGRIQARNGFAWHFGYDIEVNNAMMCVYVAINLIPGDNVTQTEIERLKPVFKAGIERIWSNKFALLTDTGVQIPILINVLFQGPYFHHTVAIYRHLHRTDPLHWHIQASTQVVAHEFGHLVQAFDEYHGGGTNPTGEAIDPRSIMAIQPTDGVPYARHYESFRAWFIHKTTLSGTVVIPRQQGENEQGSFR